jgi:hypothetical protein
MRRTHLLALGGFLAPLFLATMFLSGTLGSPLPGSFEVYDLGTINLVNADNAEFVAPDPSPREVFKAALDVSEQQLHGPYVHKNLAVFLVTLPSRDDRDYLTLDEGLRRGLVKITEKENEQVGQLTLDNQSDRPLYLHEGERLQGGKQDRTIIASQVVPPKSGPMALGSFCVEQSRWVEGSNGRAFTASSGVALAPKGVRGAAKVEQNQQGVWHSVGVQKQNLNIQLAAANDSSSINESFDSPQTRKVSDEYAKPLTAALAKHPNAVGVLVLVNGVFEEADVYPNPRVLRKLYPRLIQSYAVQAVMLKDESKRRLPSKGELAKVLQASGYKDADKSTVVRQIDGRNKLGVRALPKNLVVCVTRYQDEVVHWQMLAKNGGQSPDGDVRLISRRAAAAVMRADIERLERSLQSRLQMATGMYRTATEVYPRHSPPVYATGSGLVRPAAASVPAGQAASRRGRILGTDW